MNDSPRIFFTGATGLLGRELMTRLRRRAAHVTALVRSPTQRRERDLLTTWSAQLRAAGGSLRVVSGDLAQPDLGLPDALSLGDFDHIVHAAAIYDLEASEESLMQINVEGTRSLLERARDQGFRGVFHLLSSVAVAGDYKQTMREDQLELGQGHPHPYQLSKYRAEKLVRAVTDFQYRIYRPSAVVGDSRTGAMLRADGPYYLFPIIKKLRDSWPRFVPFTTTFDAPLNMVPVDYVADAIDHLAFAPGHDGACFHVVDGRHYPFHRTFNLLASAAGAPRVKGRGFLRHVPKYLREGLGTVKFLRQEMLADLGIPAGLAQATNRKVRYDTSGIDEALRGTKITCPAQETYVPVLWDFWLRHLDPDRDPAVRNRQRLQDATVLITGASSGVGEALAKACARAGAHVIIVARRAEELQRVASEIEAAADPAAETADQPGAGRVSWHVADLSDLQACDDLIEIVLEQYGAPDLLVNNAARSIRRSVLESLERYHDFERVMRLNFFAPVRLMRGFVPGMRARGSGHVVNVLTAGVALPTPRFSAYGASKAALGHLTDTMNAELMADGLNFTGVYLPWVRTPMMDKTGAFKDNRAMTPERAADWILEGVTQRKAHVIDSDARRRWALRAVAPQLLARITSAMFRVSADDPDAHPEFALDRTILGRFVKGKLM